MANKALKQLRKFLEGTPCGGDLVELLDQAMAHQANDPAHQMAKHQARLVKAKADVAELEAEKLRRMSSLFYNPESGEFLDGEGNVVSVPSEAFAIHQARSEKARADLLELQLAERSGELVEASKAATPLDVGLAEERGFQRAQLRAAAVVQNIHSRWMSDRVRGPLEEAFAKIRAMKMGG